MALIKCPECGKQVSNKIFACIHCGYPLEEYVKSLECKDHMCLIDNQLYDFSNIYDIALSVNKNFSIKTEIERDDIVINLKKEIQHLTDLKTLAAIALAFQILETSEIPKEFNSSKYADKEDQYEPVSVQEFNQPTCPKCGSTSISTGARGVNWKLGLIGASKTVNRCAKCGHMWEPRR